MYFCFICDEITIRNRENNCNLPVLILNSYIMKILFIINEAPYSNEKAYNALRLAMKIQEEYELADIRLYLMGEAVNCGIANQNTPKGFYNVETMLKSVIKRGGMIKICNSCIETRGIKGFALVDGTIISTITELTEWTVEADKVLVF